jgi:ElaB/YqjD/DUF883 family membrane-anchored ribosome-binding protein
MAERDDLKSEAERSAERIRQDIAAKRETISETVDRLGERIQEKLDWRGYVAEYPYAAIGAAAGLGLIAGVMLRRRSSPLDRVTEAITDMVDEVGDHVRGALQGAISGAVTRVGGRSLLKGTLYGMATKMAVDWLKGAASNALSGQDYETQTAPPHSATGTWKHTQEPSSSRPI